MPHVVLRKHRWLWPTYRRSPAPVVREAVFDVVLVDAHAVTRRSRREPPYLPLEFNVLRLKVKLRRRLRSAWTMRELRKEDAARNAANDPTEDYQLQEEAGVR